MEHRLAFTGVCEPRDINDVGGRDSAASWAESAANDADIKQRVEQATA